MTRAFPKGHGAGPDRRPQHRVHLDQRFAGAFPGVPFGGVKLPGAGREESLDGPLSYTQLKTLSIAPG